MEGKRGRGGSPSHFSEAAKEEARRRIRSGEFSSYAEIQKAFGIGLGTVSRWVKESGYKMHSKRELGDRQAIEETPMEDKQTMDALKAKWKDHPFVEPDPGVESFRTEREALEYYKMRSRYLESLYMLVDEPTEVKKKALRQLEERLREKLAKGGY